MKGKKKEVKLQKLPKPAKIAGSKALRELGYSVREIADILGISKSAAHRYLSKASEERWDEWGLQIKRLVEVKEEKVAAKALRAIEKKMGKARFYELVGLYKVIRELQQPRKGTAFRVEGGGLKVEFVEYEDKTSPNTT